MKKLLAFALFGMLMLTLSTVKAQDKPLGKNEISAGYGILSYPEMFDEFSSFWNNLFGIDSVKSSTGANYGTLSFGYQRTLGKVISLGVTASVNPILSNIVYKKGTTGTSAEMAFTLMPKMEITYVQHGVFAAYSAIAVGVSYLTRKVNNANGTTETGTLWRVGYQISLVGVRVGKNVGGFLELGYGYQGLCRLGLSAKL
ncbi:MAG: hypothetical protein WCK09_08590 [Bacteroidota bacterium]